MKHQLRAEDKGFVCDVCGWEWKREPVTYCPGVKRYAWGEWPEHLKTKKQLADAGYQTGKKLPAPSGVVAREKSPDGWMWLYDVNQAVKKAAPSEAQKQALEKGREKVKAGWECVRCGAPLRYYKERVCGACRQLARIEADQEAATEWAREMLAQEFVILDTETTGLFEAEIVQIAVINQAGETLLDTLVKPTIPIPAEATGIHGITDEMVKEAPSFGDIYPALFKILHNQHILIYNAEFDKGVLKYNRRLWHAPAFGIGKVECLMEWYAQYAGEWSDYWGDYRWQPLCGDHTALGDCMAALRLLKGMAAK